MCRDRKVTLGGGAEGGDSNGTEKERGNCRKCTAKSLISLYLLMSEFPHINFGQTCVTFLSTLEDLLIPGLDNLWSHFAFSLIK